MLLSLLCVGVLGCQTTVADQDIPVCSSLPERGVIEYQHLLALQYPNGADADGQCDPAKSNLLLPAVDILIGGSEETFHFRERKCLGGLGDLLATYERSCEAIDAAVE